MENRKKRDSFYDNAKFILIFLVVLGHYLEPFIHTNKVVYSIFGFIYMFHMPAFVFISGFFFKKEINPKALYKICVDFLVPYIIIQLLFITFTKLIGLEQYHYTLLTPVYIYWYLFAMFIWNAILKIVIFIFDSLKTKIEYMIGLSFVLGLIAGYLAFISWKLSLSRIIVLFPYFLLGYYFKTKRININNLIVNKIVAVAIFIIGLFLSFAFSDIFKFELLSCALPYKNMGFGLYGSIYRLILYMIQIVMMVSFFSLVPKQKTRFTIVGTKTLTIYILHGFIIKSLVALAYFIDYNVAKVIASPLLALLTVFLLSKIPINLKVNFYAQKSKQK